MEVSVTGAGVNANALRPGTRVLITLVLVRVEGPEFVAFPSCSATDPMGESL